MRPDLAITAAVAALRTAKSIVRALAKPVEMRVLAPLMLGLVLIAEGPAEAQSPDAPASPAMTQPEASTALAGRTWRLVQIMSMDDQTYAPQDRSQYTVTFGEDGTVKIRADCNRGTGSWNSSAPGKLQFGQIAATQAQCLPDSLHDRYMAQFPWVRSYVMRGGNLFLATMADGSIVEFEPVPAPLAATVLGEEIRTSDAAEMQQAVLRRLFDRYAEEHDIEASGAEIDAFVEDTERGMRAEGLTAADDLTAEEAGQYRQLLRDMGRSMIRRWKLNQALHRQYGGRVIFQQLGPEPLDAYRRYLEERQAAGDFQIHDEAFAEEFWRYFTDESLHSFYEPGSRAEAEAFTIPPWQRAAEPK